MLNIVTKERVLRLTNDPNFSEEIAEEITKTEIMNDMKQELYASCSLNQETLADKLNTMELRGAKLERDSNAAGLTRTVQNCLLLHGVPETDADTTAPALEIIERNLNRKLPQNSIDHHHGRAIPGEVKPRPIVIKFISCQDMPTRRRQKGRHRYSERPQ